MISAKTMITDKCTTTANGLEYEEEEDCDMDAENVNGVGIAVDDENNNGVKKLIMPTNESTNGVERNEIKNACQRTIKQSASTSSSGSNLIISSRSVIDGGTRSGGHVREAKILETSIANLKKKLQKQQNQSVDNSTSSNSISSGSNTPPTRDGFGIEYSGRAPTLQSVTGSEGSPLETEDYSGGGSSEEEEAQTAVERSLAAMRKSRASNSKCSTSSSRNSFNDIDDGDGDGDDEESKSDAFLDRIFNSSGTYNSATRNFDLSGISGSGETHSSPRSGTASDNRFSVAVRRKRQRRNPVWPYFIVKDGVATCKHKNCNYSTGSVFSTNLKVHLRTHHHDLYDEVLKAEEEQQQQEQQNPPPPTSTVCSITTATTITAPTTATTPYMHRVTTTALPAFGSTTSSTSSTNINTDTAAMLEMMKVLKQVGNLRSGFQVTNPTLTDLISSTAPAGAQSTAVQPIFSRSFPEFSKGSLEQQQQLQLAASRSASADLARALPDFLKAALLESSAANSQLGASSTTRALRSSGAGNYIAEALNRAKQRAPLPERKASRGRVKKSAAQAGVKRSSSQKRRRLRRHPVWRFFKDIGDGSKTVKCLNCSFSTSAPFSTNLKMHLKAHHKCDFRLILALETQQREDEGIVSGDPIPPALPAPEQEKNSNDDGQEATETGDEQPQAKKKAPSTGGLVDDEELLTTMTNTERIKAMIEMAAASQGQPIDTEDAAIDTDYAAAMAESASRTLADEGSDLIDTELLARLGLVTKTDLMMPSSTTTTNLQQPLQQKNRFPPNPHAAAVKAGTTGASVNRANISTASPPDTTKSVRTISKRLPTGEVVKVRQTRKCVENLAPTPTVSCSQPIVAATATINTTKPIIPSRDLATVITDERPAIYAAKDIALGKFLARTNAFYLLGVPEFRYFVATLDPTYQLPLSDYLKRLLEALTGFPSQMPAGRYMDNITGGSGQEQDDKST